MEMNTRLQVEHPVTECITGMDLVELQFHVAAGGALPFAQGDLAITGHAVEARLYAEDPENDFLPSTGKLWALRLPDEGNGIRVDAGVREGGEVTAFYDPMIAKIIAHGATRDEALDRLSAALAKTIVAGPRTNARFLRKLADHPDFRGGKLDTGLIDRNREALGAAPQPVDANALALAAAAAARAAAQETRDPWSVADGFTLQGTRASTFLFKVDGARAEVRALPGAALPDGDVARDGATGDILIVRDNRQTRAVAFDPFDIDWDALEGGGGASVKAPMHGKLVALFVKPGETVQKGQKLAIVEAMKMEHALAAPRDGTVEAVFGDVGQQVGEGQKIVTLAEA
jgi:3-methylcrotonyl-CoA carboxylase alpha subunit